MNNALHRLSSTLPHIKILTAVTDKEKYETGWRYGKGKALAVAMPETTEEVAAILDFCDHTHIGVVAQGGNTGLVAASTPDGTGEQLILSTERLHHKLVKRDGMHIRVGAGVVLQWLNEQLASEQLWFPIDISASGSCHIGGMIATNAAGTRSYYYGSTKTRVLALEVVTAKGEIKEITLPAMNDKPPFQDNSHLDMDRPFCGSSGWLGVITQATLALAPLPEQSSSALVVPHHPDAISEIRHSFGRKLYAMEYMDRSALSLVAKHIPDTPHLLSQDEGACALLCETALEEQALEALLIELYEKGVITTARSDKPELFWHVRHHISESLGKEGPVTACDISCPPAQLPALRQRLDALLAKDWPELRPCPFGHELSGVMHYNIIWPGQKKDEAVLRDAVYEIVVREFQGSFSAEHNIGPYNQRYYDLYTSAEEKAKCHALKERYDPRRILNPNVCFD